MRFFKIIFLCSLLIWSIVPESFAIDVILTDSTNRIRTSGDYSHIYEDSSNALTLSDILKLDSAGKMSLLKTDVPRNDNIRSTYWIKYNIVNQANPDISWIIEVPDPRASEVTAYIPNEKGEYEEYKQGSSLPFDLKIYPHKNYEFKLNFSGKKKLTVYLKFYSKVPTGISSIVRKTDDFISWAINEYYILGLFYGLILLMAVYNLFMFMMLKERAYLYYVFYALSVGFYLNAQDGTGFQFIWPGKPWFNLYAITFFSYTMVLCCVLFTRSFLKTRLHHSKFDQVLIGVIAIRTLLFILTLIFRFNYMFFYYFDAGIFALAYTTGIVSLKEGNKSAKFFVLAYTLLLTGFLITTLKEYRLIDNNIFTVYAFNFGVILEIAFLSMAMADRLRNEIEAKDLAKAGQIQQLQENEKLKSALIKELEERQKEKERVNRELEDKVKERTIELNEANEKLLAQAEEINRMNIQLDKDNRKLQKDLTIVEKARITNEEVTYEEFMMVYPDDFSCMQYLADLKWKNGYSCRKCGFNEFGKGKEVLSRRCKKCGYNESITVYTLFHKLKFPLKKAFYLLFLTTSKENQYTVDELSEVLDLRRNTCWSFKKKIEEKIAENQKAKKRFNRWEYLILNE